LPNVHAYAQKSVAAGEIIDFRVASNGVPYQMDVVRLGWDTDSPAKDWVVGGLPAVAAPVAQPIRRGSYVHVSPGITSTQAFSQMTLECWVRPDKDDWQGLISRYTFPNSEGERSDSIDCA
jgi:hypothetical protein